MSEVTIGYQLPWVEFVFIYHHLAVYLGIFEIPENLFLKEKLLYLTICDHLAAVYFIVDDVGPEYEALLVEEVERDGVPEPRDQRNEAAVILVDVQATQLVTIREDDVHWLVA